MSNVKIEFAVQMKGEKCAQSIRNALVGFGEVEIDAKQGRVIVQTQRPWTEIHDRIESTGRKTVLSGFGGKSAVAIVNNSGNYNSIDYEATQIQGIIRFCAIAEGKPGMVLDGVVDGLCPGQHGLHIHESGDVSQGCSSLGEHYNPLGSPHGGPKDESAKRHAGDLGNIRASNNGRAIFRLVDPILQIDDIIGRSVAITEHPDDLGRGRTARSHIDGNAGKRLACGIIARSAGIMQNFKRICACSGKTLWDERDKASLNR